jgi:hypothetical protein
LGANFFLQYNNGNGLYAIRSGPQAGNPLTLPSSAFGGIATQLTDGLSYDLQALDQRPSRPRDFCARWRSPTLSRCRATRRASLRADRFPFR